MKRIAFRLALASSAVALAPSAHAAILLPGSTDQMFDPFNPATQGAVLATTSAPGTTLTFSAVMRSAVYRNTLGTLDFYYQVARTGSGSFGNTDIDAFTAFDLTGFTVDAFVSPTDPDAGGFFTAVSNDIPSTTTVGRSDDGSTLQTFFNANGLGGSQNSATYIFRTNAVTFRTGTFGVLNGSAFEGLAFAPGAIPEPATWAMMIMGFGFVGHSMRRRAYCAASRPSGLTC